MNSRIALQDYCTEILSQSNASTSRSSFINSLLIATAACAPSEAATITNWTSREASPATYKPGNIRGFIFARRNTAVFGKVATQFLCQIGCLVVAGAEKHSASRQLLRHSQIQCVQARRLFLQAARFFLRALECCAVPDAPFAPPSTPMVHPCKAPSPGSRTSTRAPIPSRFRRVHKSPVADRAFPSHRSKDNETRCFRRIPQSFKLRKLVDHAGCKQQFARGRRCSPLLERYFKTIFESPRVSHFGLPEVRPFRTAAVVRAPMSRNSEGSMPSRVKKPVEPMRKRHCVACPRRKQHTPAAAAEHERGAQTGRTGTNDDHIKRWILPSTNCSLELESVLEAS